MRDVFQPGGTIVLPSGRRVMILRVRGDSVLCTYVSGAQGVFGDELSLSKLFCARHCLLVPGAPA